MSAVTSASESQSVVIDSEIKPSTTPVKEMSQAKGTVVDLVSYDDISKLAVKVSAEIKKEEDSKKEQGKSFKGSYDLTKMEKPIGKEPKDSVVPQKNGEWLADKVKAYEGTSTQLTEKEFLETVEKYEDPYGLKSTEKAVRTELAKMSSEPLQNEASSVKGGNDVGNGGYGYQVGGGSSVGSYSGYPAKSSFSKVPSDDIRPYTDITSKGVFSLYGTNVDGLLNTDLGGSAGRTLYRNDAALHASPTGKGMLKFLDTKTSHTSLMKIGVSVSPKVLYKGKEFRTMTATTSTMKQLKNVTKVDFNLGSVSANVTSMTWGRAGEKSSYAITATPDRIRAFTAHSETLPTLDYPERLKTGEIITQEFGLSATADTELRAMLGGGLIQGGLYGNVGSENERAKKRITVRAAKTRNGHHSVVVSMVDVTKDSIHSKVGVIVQSKDLTLLSDSLGKDALGSVYNHTTYATDDGSGTRVGRFVELDLDTEKGRADYQNIIENGFIPSNLLQKDSAVLFAGDLVSKSDRGDTKINNTTYYTTKFGGQHGHNMDSKLSYNVDQYTSYDVIKADPNSSMAGKLGIYNEADGGADVSMVTNKTIKSDVRKKRNDTTSYFNITNYNEKKGIESSVGGASRINSEGHYVMSMLEHDLERIANDKEPVFKEFKLILPDGQVLDRKQASDYLNSHSEQRNWVERMWSGEEQLSITMSESSDQGKELQYPKMIAGDAKDFAQKKHDANHNRHLFLPANKIGNVDMEGLTDKEISTRLLLKQFDSGEILLDLEKYHEAAGRKESYPLTVTISLASDDYKKIPGPTFLERKSHETYEKVKREMEETGTTTVMD